MERIRTLSKAQKRIYGVLGIALFLGVLYLLKLNFNNYISDIRGAAKSVFVPAAIAIFISYLIYPLYKRISQKIKNKNASAVITIIIFFVVFLGVLGLIGFLIVQQIIDIISRIDEAALTNFIDRLSSWLNFLPPDIYNEITNELGTIDFNKILGLLTTDININDSIQIIISDTVNGLKTTLYSIIMIVMTPVFLFFFLRDPKRIFDAFIKVIPKKYHKEEIREMLLIANSSTEKYMRGKIISIGLLSFFFSISFSILFILMYNVSFWEGIIYGLIFGIILALLDLIPYIGPAVGIILPGLFILVVSSSISEFFFAILALSIIDIIGQSGQKVLVEPYVMSKEVEIHPLAIFSGMLFFGTLFGFVGLIIATPIVATIRNSYRYIAEKSDLYKED